MRAVTGRAAFDACRSMLEDEGAAFVVVASCALLMLEAAEKVERELKNAGVRVKLDARESQRPGWKFSEYEVQGVPIRIAIGPRDVQNGVVEMARRDTLEKSSLPMEDDA